MSEEEGALYEGEAEIIQEIIKLGDKTSKDLHDAAPLIVSCCRMI